MVRSKWPGGSDVVSITTNQFWLRLLAFPDMKGIDFKTSGNVNIISPGLWTPGDIYIGAGGFWMNYTP